MERSQTNKIFVNLPKNQGLENIKKLLDKEHRIWTNLPAAQSTLLSAMI